MSNPDRTLILDLSAIEEKRGPQPNDFFLCITPREGGACAYAIAVLLQDGGCATRDCEDCNGYRRLFWALTNELGPQLQGELFSNLVNCDYAIPDGPWEEVK